MNEPSAGLRRGLGATGQLLEAGLDDKAVGSHPGGEVELGILLAVYGSDDVVLLGAAQLLPVGIPLGEKLLGLGSIGSAAMGGLGLGLLGPQTVVPCQKKCGAVYAKTLSRAAAQIAMTAGCFNRRSTEIA